MSLVSNIGVLLSGSLGRASKLLVAARNGDAGSVSEILSSQPQLATYCGFHGTNSALHRAAAGGHLDVCRSVLEPLKQRLAVAESLVAAGRRKPSTAVRWRRLLTDVLEQRSNKGFTPLMVACRNGHALVAAYLLREGADPLAADGANLRTALHYAASGGHVDCLRLLCSETTLVATQQGARPLRNVLVQDLTVQSCRYIDQRAYGGLTALHFAVVTGQLDAVLALLQAGASIMVKTDGEAYLGEEYLVPGSTPLHIAVMINSVSIVHALLQAHAELMNVMGQTLDERGRRAWEGHSRTDIRSVRNHFRKLPFHLARDRGATALAQLVDPRIPVYAALDGARDKDHGIGPKRLQTIVSIVLQQQLLSWLDACQQDMEAAVRAAAQVKDAAAASVSHGSMGTSASAGNEVAVVGASTPASPIQAALAAIKSGLQRSPSNVHAQGSSGGGGSSGGIAAVREGVAVQEEVQHSGYATPHTGAAAPPVARALPQTAGTADEQSAPSPFARAQQTSSTQSAPATPLRPVLGGTAIAPPPASVPAPQALTAHARPNRLSSLHGYMGLLSVKASGRRSLSVENLAGLRLPDGSQPRSLPLDAAPREQLPSSTQRGTEGLARQLSSPPSFSGAGEARGAALAATEGISAGGGLAPRGRFLSEQHAGGPQLTVVTGSLHHGSRPGHRRSASAASASVLGVLTSLRGRLRASENGAASGGAPGVLAATAAGPAAVCAAATLVELPQALDKEPLKSEKDLSEGEEEAGPSGSEASAEEAECGVCLDHGVEVAFASCQHKLCISCARNLTAQARKPPHCPFCRKTVYAFTRLEVPPRPATAMPVHICAH